jgi:hypothetical protein
VTSFYSHVLCRSNADLRKEGEREVMPRHDDRASMRSRDVERSEGSNDRGWCGGDAEGIFVHTSVARR